MQAGFLCSLTLHWLALHNPGSPKIPSPAGLLHYVRQLMREQPLPGKRRGRVFSAREHDIAA